jgi:hypothetical protein
MLFIWNEALFVTARYRLDGVANIVNENTRKVFWRSRFQEQRTTLNRVKGRNKAAP